MDILFAGAAREVTGPRHVVRTAGRTILLDCGLFQGRRRASREKNLRLPLPAAQIDAVVLSHAHIDHAGRLPLLGATRDLCAIMLADGARIRELQVASAGRGEQLARAGGTGRQVP
jgi:metallo-beta-lactamase family protein